MIDHIICNMSNLKERLKRVLIGITALFVLAGVAIYVFLEVAPQIGGEAKGDRLVRIQNSSNYDGEIFVNTVETTMNIQPEDFPSLMWKFFTGTPGVEPEDQLKTTPFTPSDYPVYADSQTAVTWFGHSTILVKVEGKTLLFDPVFSPRTSMVSFMGPKNFNLDHYMHVDELPEVDAVVISHDHYDHLDYETILALKGKVKKFFMPLGIGAHFERWEIPAEDIVEMDWWEEAEFEGLKLALTPARHFSGRALTDRSKTLWGSWSVIGEQERLYFSGDGGYTPEFKRIGERYGPFDLAFLECGQYNEMWSSIHMMPEETVQASIDLNAATMIPIHWGKFPLALHTWKDPVERMTQEADKLGVDYLLPTIGETMILTQDRPQSRWWEKYQ